MEPSRDDPADDLRPEYDLTQLRGGVRGKYARRLAHGDGYETTAGFVPNNENGKLSPDEVASFLKRVWDTLSPKFERCVVPITGTNGPDIGVWGTGTLFRVAGMSFLVTASHVITDARKHGISLAICDARPAAPAIALGGRVSGHLKYDVAVIELDHEAVAALPNRAFLSVHEADRESRRPARGTYCLCGFPSALGKPSPDRSKLSAMPLTAFIGLYPGPSDPDELPGYDERYHLTLDARQDGVSRLDEGAVPTPEDLRGMSGSSVWQVYYEGLLTRHWAPDDAVIVGVQTGVYKKSGVVKGIKGTRWWVVDRVIREAYPELSGPLDLHIPMSGT